MPDYQFKFGWEAFWFFAVFVAGAVADALAASPELWTDPSWLLSTFTSAVLRGVIGGLVALVGRLRVLTKA